MKLAEEENSLEQLEKSLCVTCPWDQHVPGILPWLNEYLEMQDGGCQLERHELLNEHWRLLGYMKATREKYHYDMAKLKADQLRAEKEAQSNG